MNTSFEGQWFQVSSTCAKSLGLEGLEPHARKYCVCCSHLPSLAWESRFPVSEILDQKRGRSIHDECHSCHPEDHHHQLEDDDQELGDGHQLFQLEPCSAGHATGFTVLEMYLSLAPVVA